MNHELVARAAKRIVDKIKAKDDSWTGLTITPPPVGKFFKGTLGVRPMRRGEILGGDHARHR